VEVKEGEVVSASSVVGYFNPHGNTSNYYMARELDISPFDVPDAMLKKEGEAVYKGEVVARGRGLFNRKEFYAPEDGILERISEYTGWVTIRGLPIPIYAGYPGIVDKISPEKGVFIRSSGTLLQGIFGIGGPVSGRLEVLPVGCLEVLEPEHVLTSHEDCIVAGGARVSLGFLNRATRLGVKAVVTGGIHKRDLDEFLGYALGVAITGLEPTISVILTEGFGTLPMREEVKHLLGSHHQQEAFASGATQVRAGVIRPELFVPGNTIAPSGGKNIGRELSVGARVRVVRSPHFGRVGQIASLPEVRMLPTESAVLAVNVQFDTGETLLIPVANIEPLGGE
jgi:hypothetical protein